MNSYKKFKKSLLATAIVLSGAVTCALLSSCEHYVLPQITLSPDTLVFSAQGGTAPVWISTNVSTDILSNNDNWVTCDKRYASEDCELIFTAIPNELTRRRNTSFFIKSETINRTLTVIQEPSDLN